MTAVKPSVDSIDKSKLPVIRHIDSAIAKRPSTEKWTNRFVRFFTVKNFGAIIVAVIIMSISMNQMMLSKIKFLIAIVPNIDCLRSALMLRSDI